MDHLGTVSIALVLLYGAWWTLRKLVPGPYRFVLRILRRVSRSLWRVMYQLPAARRGKAFGIFWCACCLWIVLLAGTILEQGKSWGTVAIFAVCIAAYRFALHWWERRAAARVQRPLPHREQW
jgi:hypothetical protein